MAKDYITIKDLGMKVEYVRLDRVLEIIDKSIKHNKPVITVLQAKAVSELNHVKHDVLALKGEQG